MAGRATIVGAAETSVGNVRDHNEDAHFIDPERGIFLVCDGMGGHAAGEVASAIAVETIRDTWCNESTRGVVESWLETGTPAARRELLSAIHGGVVAAHAAILAEARRDRTKGGMGTTLVGALVVGGDIVFAHCGDSRAYLVRDGIAMQLTEDHTLLARLLAAGVDVDVNGDGSRFKSMLTNALGIGDEVKVSSFVVPLADGDRFLLCSDGITEYVQEPEIGEVLTNMASPGRAAQRLVELALMRGGGDNATALVVRVLEAGETARPLEIVQREQKAIDACPLWAKVSPQQRLRALRIAIPRDFAANEVLPAHSLADRVAWIVIEGELEQAGGIRGPGSLLYPEALLLDRPLPGKAELATTRGEVRVLAVRSDDFRELCEDDNELAEVLLEALAAELSTRRPDWRPDVPTVDAKGTTDPVAKVEPKEAKETARTDARATDDALDDALSKITVGAQWSRGSKDAVPMPGPDLDRAVDKDDHEPESVIVVEADQPPEPAAAAPRAAAAPAPPRRGLGDYSDAEISIERYEDSDAEIIVSGGDASDSAPLKRAGNTEPSEPEIMILKNGTADSPPPRAKPKS